MYYFNFHKCAAIFGFRINDKNSEKTNSKSSIFVIILIICKTIFDMTYNVFINKNFNLQLYYTLEGLIVTFCWVTLYECGLELFRRLITKKINSMLFKLITAAIFYCYIFIYII